MDECEVCRAVSDRTVLRVSEMMFGTGQSFSYSECGACGTLILQDIPVDLGSYYADGYYAHAAPRNTSDRRLKQLAYFSMVELSRRLPWNTPRLLRSKGFAPNWLDWIKPLSLKRSSAILDVGCGAGEGLLSFRAAGFHNLLGVDRYIEENQASLVGIPIRRGELQDINGTYDLIMFNHSFEHMADPLEVLTSASEKLSDRGGLMVRVPLADSLAYRTYREYWVQLDAPRHLYVYTMAGLAALAERAGLRVVKVDWDSTGFQFWGSELYLRGLPLDIALPVALGPTGSIFTKRQLKGFELRARQLNRAGDGDQGMVLMRRRESQADHPKDGTS